MRESVVGEIELLPGQVARLAESPTQPGWDLRIENEDGSVAELIQLKATESMAYVKSALDEYPGIRVAVPSEVDDSTDQVLGTDISNEQLELVTKTQMEELGEGMAEDLLDKGAELAADSIPFVSMITTGVIEGTQPPCGTLHSPRVTVAGSTADRKSCCIRCYWDGFRHRPRDDSGQSC